MIDCLTQPVRRPKIPNRPLVTMMVPTYGRCAKQPEMLNEIVWWCCNQTHPNVEVLILNDAPNQTLTCDHSKVRVVNWPERLPDLGTKMNVLTLLAAGTVCCPAEDDDISLPHRAAQAAKMVTRHDCWFPMLWLYAQNKVPPVFDGNGHGYTSSAFKRHSMMGNHPRAIKGHDEAAAAWMKENLRVNEDILTDHFKAEVSYVYRWGVSPLHLSGHADPITAFRNNNPGPDGEYKIVPKMLTDWEKIARGLAGWASPGIGCNPSVYLSDQDE